MSQQPESPSRSAKPRKKLIPLLALAVVAALAGGAYVYYHSNDSQEREPRRHRLDGGKRDEGRRDEDRPVVVSVESATQGDYPIYLNGLGTVTALKTVTVHSRVDGELIKIAFTEGQMVKQGDLLAEIDPRPFQVQLQQAVGQLQRDEALLKNAHIDKSRYDTLLSQDSIASQQTVTQESLVKQYQGTVEMDKSQVNNARLQLTYAHLTAPISGRVGLRQIDQGNIIHASDANGLVVITQLQPITVIFTLPEDKVQPLIQRWRDNQTIEVQAFDRAGKTRLTAGKLTAIDNQIDPTTGTLKLRAQFDNEDMKLFANQFVNVRMHLDTLPAVTQIPSAAVQHDTEGAFVYVVNQDNTVSIRRITLAPNETPDGRVAVVSNLAVNEQVVVEGTDRLKEGSRIDIAQKNGAAVEITPEALANKLERRRGDKFHKRDR